MKLLKPFYKGQMLQHLAKLALTVIRPQSAIAMIKSSFGMDEVIATVRNENITFGAMWHSIYNRSNPSHHVSFEV